jgi:Glycosyl hydrolases related to GH101 family, GH129
MRYIHLFLACLLCLFSIYAEPIALDNNILKATIDPETLSVELESKNNKWMVSLPTKRPQKYLVDNIISTNNSVEFNIENINVKYTLINYGVLASFTSDKAVSICWPVVDFNDANLILPYQDGRFIPHDADNWWNYLHDREFDIIESLSMPFIASNQDNGTIIWIFEQPHRNNLIFKDHIADVTHNFVTLPAQKPYVVKIIVSDNKEVTESAKIYREEFLKNKNLVSLSKRQVTNPKLNILPGALHAYLWGNGDIAMRDVKDWGGLVKYTANNTVILTRLNAQTKKILITAQKSKYLDKYQKSSVLAGLNAALLKLSITQRTESLHALTEFLKPNQEHGQAVSIAMLHALKKLQIDNARLVLVGAMDGAYHQEVATAADKMGYLFGPYDSYASVHDPKLKDTEGTWDTPQMQGNLYDTSAMKDSNGNYYTGFQKKGRVPNPKVLWPYVKTRFEENLKVNYNSYFLDVDAAGEYRDDYSDAHPLTKEENVFFYKERLEWLKSKGLVVASEKGIAEFVDVIDIAEGSTSYPFYWEDEDFKNKKSKSYIGNYWPSDEPTLFFGTIALKEQLLERQFDPAFKLPLYEYVFHDYVIAVDHWEVPVYKFDNAYKSRLLTHILYQSTPIYHLNIESIEHPIFLESYNKWKNLNQKLAFASLDEFKYLTSDRLVQQTRFGDIIITANYKTESYNNIPPMSAMINHNDRIQIVVP